jgi:HEPN domain-containing protein
MRSKLDHARGWLLKADSDLLTAKRILEGKGPYDTACFHAHQAIEKYLKACLALSDMDIPRTHNLEELQRLCLQQIPEMKIDGMDLAEITPYAVELRYDFEFWPDRQTAEQALEIAEQVRQAALASIPQEAHP